MQLVSEVMSRNARFVAPGDTLQRAAQLMDELDVGALPVCEGDGDRLVGMLTDRDIVVRAIADGKAPQTAHVDEAMSADVRWCFDDQPLDEVMRQMADSQVRRIPVLSHDARHRLVGIVALADLALDVGAADGRVEQVVRQVSSPGGGAVPGAAPAAGKNANGVLEALTGIDQRQPGTRLEEVGVSGQPRIDNSGEPLRNAGSYDPADNASSQADVDGRKPPSKPANSV
jgi:CBS domain-containing protein